MDENQDNNQTHFLDNKAQETRHSGEPKASGSQSAFSFSGAEAQNGTLLSLAEASKKTGYHQDYLGFLCRTGKLEGFKIGRNWVIPASGLENFQQNHKNGAEAAANETETRIPVKVESPARGENVLGGNEAPAIAPVYPTRDFSSLTSHKEILAAMQDTTAAVPHRLPNGDEALPNNENPKVELSHLRNEVFASLNDKVKGIAENLESIEAKVKAAESLKFLERDKGVERVKIDQGEKGAKVQERVLPQVELLAIGPDYSLDRRPNLQNKFQSNFNISDALQTDKIVRQETAAPHPRKGLAAKAAFLSAFGQLKVDQLKDSFRYARAGTRRTFALATAIAVLGFLTTLGWNYLTSPWDKQNNQTTVVYQDRDRQPPFDFAQGANSLQGTGGDHIVLREKLTTETIVKSLAADTSLLNSLIDQRLSQYLAEGKFKGEKGEKGEPGVAQTLQGGWTVGYVQPSQPGGVGAGTIGSFTYFSADKLTATNATVDNSLTVNGTANFSGDVNLNGTTTIANLNTSNLNLGFTQGSVIFQGSSGLAQDNGNFYWDDTNNRLGIGTASPVSTLTVAGSGSTSPFTIASSSGATMLTLSHTGYFGINTSTPSDALTVAGNGLVTGDLNVLGSISGASLSFSSSSLTTLTVTGTSTLSQAVMNFLQATTANITTLNVTGTSTLATTSISQLNVSGNISLATMTQGSVLFAGAGGVLSQNNSNLYWDNTSRYFNIGTSTVQSTFAIQGSGSANVFSIASSTGASLLTVTPSGNVGIGTSTPIAKLDVQGGVINVAPATGVTGGLTITSSGGANASVLVTNGTQQAQLQQGFVGSTSNSDFAIYTNGTAKLHVTNTGNVGIGTTSPLAKLDVYGNLNVATGSTPALFVDTGTGKVGIGINAPVSTLDVRKDLAGSLGPTLTLSNRGGSSGSAANIDAILNTSGVVNTRIGMVRTDAGRATDIFFSVYNTPQDSLIEAMRITSAGNLGIGTTTPGRTFVVAGDMRATGILYDSSNSAGTSGNFLMSTASGYQWTSTSTLFGGSQVTGSGISNYVARWTGTNTLGTGVLFDDGTNVGIGTTSPSKLFTVGNNNQFTVDSGGNVVASGTISVGINKGLYGRRSDGVTVTMQEISVADNFNSLLSSGSSYGVAIKNTTSQHLLTVLNGGNVGIGNSAPTYMLDVSPTTATSTNLFRAATSTGAGLYVTSAGNVGIGTTSPSTKLEVHQTTSGEIARFTNTTGTGWIRLFQGSTNMGTIGYGSAGNIFTGALSNSLSIRSENALHLGSNGDNLTMTLLSGNVGIGSTSPKGKLDIDTLSSLWYADDGTKSSLLVSYGSTKLLNMYLGTNYDAMISNPYSGASTGGLHFRTGGDTSAYERLTITKNGSIGIGTSTPGYGLTVATTSYFTGLATFTGGITSPGTGASSERYGLNAIASNTNSIAIGNGANATGINTIAIGLNASSSGNSTIVIGKDATSSASSALVVGTAATASSNAVAAGATASASGANSIAVGSAASAAFANSIAIGQSANAGFASNIVLGSNAVGTAAHQFVAGGPTGSTANWISDVYFGAGVLDSAPVGYTIHGTGGSGTDITGGDLQLAGGQGTGSALGGALVFKTAASSTTGSSLNALTERMRITPQGNVGIGTSTPTAKLHIDGSAGNLMYLSNNGTWKYYVDSNGHMELAGGIYVYNGSGGTAGITMASTNALRWGNGGMGSIDSGISRYAAGVISVGNGTAGDYTGTLIAGNVGIGLTSPNYKLEVAGTASTTALNVVGNIYNATLTASSLVMSDAGKNLASVTLGAGLTLNGGTLNTTQAGGAWTVGNGLIYNATSTDLVGIGTITPTTSLFVQGKGGTNPFAIASSTGSQLLTVTQSGNVGIGTTTPGQVLDVNGNIRTNAQFLSTVNSNATYDNLDITNSSTGNGAQTRINFHSANSNGLIYYTGQNWSGAGVPSNSFGFWNSNSSGAIVFGTNNTARAGVSASGTLASGLTSSAISGINDALSLTPASYNDGAVSGILWSQGSINSQTTLGRFGLLWSSANSQMNFVWRDLYNGGVGSTELMRLTGAGNLGIGYTDPGTAKLAINGNVGIGTTSPAALLAVGSNSSPLATNGVSGALFAPTTISTPAQQTVVAISPRITANTGGQQSMLYIKPNLAADLDTLYGMVIDDKSGGGNPYGYAGISIAALSNFTNSVGVLIGTTTIPTGDFGIYSATSYPNYFAGNVGIGTASPQSVLHVYGTAGVSTPAIIDTANAQSLLQFKSNNVSKGFVGYTTAGSGGLSFLDAAGTGVNMLVTNTGNVGIGTTSPMEKLDVVGNIKVSGYITLPTEATSIKTDDGKSRIFYSSNAGSFYYGSAHSFKDLSGNNESRITPGGISYIQSTAFGIGTTTPSQKLVVVGDARITGALYDSTNSAGSSGNFLMSTATGYAWTSTSTLFGGSQVTGSGTNGLVTRWTGANTISTGILIDNGSVAGVNATSSSYAFNIQGTGSVHPLQVGTSTNTSMLVVRGDSGNVGIGTSGPLSLLHIYGTQATMSLDYASTNATFILRNNGVEKGLIGLAGSAGNLVPGTAQNDLVIRANNAVFFSANSSASTHMVIKNDGNVGIGTTSPQSVLHVYGTAGVTTPLMVDTANSQSFAQFKSNNVSKGFVGFTTVGDDGMAFLNAAGTTANLLVTDSGNVGIGTTTPGALLVVATSTSQSPFVVTSAGNVGIGTTGPARLLDVNGDMAIDSIYFQKGAGGKLWYSGGGFSLSNNGGTSGASIALGKIARFGDSNTYVNFPSDGNIEMKGNVGIGTTSPTQKLHVYSSAASTNVYSLTETVDTSSLVGSRIKGGNANADWGMVTNRSDLLGSADNLGFYKFSGTTGAKMVIQDNGNVGIGTTTPGFKLDVVGAAGVASSIHTLAANTGGVLIGYGGYDIQGRTSTDQNGNLALNPYGGNVGIGTSSPSSFKLQVLGNVGPDRDLAYDLGSSALRWNNLYMGGNLTLATFTQGSVLFAGAGGTLTQKNAQFFWDNTNNRLGLGTSTPTATLEVNGSFKVNNGAIAYSTTTNLTTIDNLELGSMTFDSNAGMVSWIDMPVTASSTQGTVHSYTAQLDGNPLLTVYGQSDGAGSIQSPAVGVGTSTPTARFSVQGAAGSNALVDFASSTGTSLFRITASGNVGIGNTNPGGKLQITVPSTEDWPTLGTAAGSLRIAGSTNLWGMYAGLKDNTGGGWLQVMRGDAATAYNLALQPVGGNVGIGTTGPQSKLEVYGGDIWNTTANTSYYLKINANASASDSVNFTGPYSSNFLQFDFDNNGISGGALTTVGVSGKTVSLNGNVGIGTTIPTSMLMVNGGDIAIGPNGGSIWPLLQRNGTSGGFIVNTNASVASGNSVLSVRNNSGTDLLTVLGGGNVGIGTTSPNSKLQVNTAVGADTDLLQLSNTVSNSNLVGLVFSNAAGPSGAIRTVYTNPASHSGTEMRFYTNPTGGNNNLTQRMVIDMGGNVGIGTTSPSTKLDVYNTFGDTLALTNTTANGYVRMKFNNNNSMWLGVENTTGATLAGGSLPNAGIINVTSNNPFQIATNNTAQVTILGSGNVGIGTTSPNSKLVVHESGADGGDATYPGAVQIQSAGGITTSIGGLEFKAAGTGGGYGFRITNPDLGTGETPLYIQRRSASASWTNAFTILGTTGNVGIGTTTPGRTLTVVGDIRATGILYDSTNSAGTSGNFLMSTATGYAWTSTSTLFGGAQVSGSGTNGLVTRWTGANTISTGILIDNGSVAGVNATSSSYAFNIQGTGSVHPLQVGTSTNTSMLVVRGDSGNVGIGAASPAQKLQVNGTGLFGNGSDSLALYVSSDNVLGIQTLLDASTNPGSYAYGGDNNVLVLQASQGRVGIGTTTMSAKLAIQATTGNTPFEIASSTGSTLFRVMPSGNVGVGFANVGGFVNINSAYFRPSTGATTVDVYSSSSEATINLISNASTTGAQMGGLYFTRSTGQSDAHYQIAGIQARQSGVGALSGGDLFFFTKIYGAGTASTSPSMVIMNSGNVGIGTSSPRSVLDVQAATDATFRFARNGTNTGQLIFQDSSNSAINAQYNAYTHQFMYGSSEWMRITNTGNVGIGTTSPVRKLQVESAANTLVDIGLYQAGVEKGVLAAAGASDQFFQGSVSGDVAVRAYTGRLMLGANIGTSGPAATILQNGNVGIGTTTPGAGLVVSNGNFFVSSSTATSTFAGGLSVNNGAILHDWSSGLTSIDNLQLGNMNFEADAGILTWVDMPVTASATQGTIESYTARIDGNALFSIYSESNGSGGIQNSAVGVGTSTPIARFSVQGAAGTNALVDFASSTGTSLFRVTAAGNVGIGTTTPLVALTVQSQSGNQDVISINRSGINRDWRLGIKTTTGTLFIGDATAGADRLAIDTNGNIGIGTTTPAARLDVYKTSQTYNSEGSSSIMASNGNKRVEIGYDTTIDAGFIWAYHAGTANKPLVLNASGGNVGIGTTSPQDLLEIGSGTTGRILMGATSGVREYYASGSAPRWQISRDLISSGQAGIGFAPVNGGTILNFVGTDASGNLAMYTNGTANQRLTVTTAGNVGIGTTNPTSALMVNGDIKTYTTNQGIYARYAASDNYKTGIVWNSNLGSVLMLGNNGTNYIVAGNTNTGGNLKFVVNNTSDPTAASFDGTTAMTITSGANVGVGTTSPAARFSVYNSGGSVAALFQASGAGAVGIGNNNGVGTIQGYNNDGATVSAALTIQPNSSSNLYLTPSSASNVGIGTTSPIFKMQVAGTANVGDGPFVVAGGAYGNYFYDSSDTSAYFYTPNFMVRSDSPTTTLAGTRANSVFYNKNGTQNSWTKISLANNETSAVGANPVSIAGIAAQLTTGTAGAWASGDLALWTKSGQNENEVLRVTSGQNVGIGTTTPAFKLDVYGRIRADGGEILANTSRTGMGWVTIQPTSAIESQIALNVIDSSGNSYASLRGNGNAYFSGNVGIGTTSPSNFKLQAAGNVGPDANNTYDLGSSSYKWRNLYVNNITAGVLSQYSISGMSASATQARQYEIARVSMDYNDWSNTGPIEVELLEKYYGPGIKKRYSVYWGYNNTYGIRLVEASGEISDSGSNNFSVTVGAPVVVSGDTKYVPIYVNVRNYATVDAIIRTNRTVTTTNPPTTLGEIYINTSASPSNIADFTADSGISIAPTYFNVGIGTTTPTSALYISTDNSKPALSFIRTDVPDAVWNFRQASSILTLGGSQALNLYNSGSVATDFGIRGNTSGAAQFMVQGSSGNVGIGTTSPSARLSVEGGDVNVGYGNGDTQRKINVYGNGSNPGQINLYGLGGQYLTITGKGSSATVPAKINSAYGLELTYNDSGNGEENGFRIKNNSTTPFQILNNNVGIGTTTPNVTLEVHKASGQPYIRLSSGGNTGSLFQMERYGTDNNYFNFETGANAQDSLSIYSTSYASPIMTLLAGGNVGIGTTSPKQQLQIGAYWSGTANSGSTVLVNSSGGLQDVIPTVNISATSSVNTSAYIKAIGLNIHNDDITTTGTRVPALAFSRRATATYTDVLGAIDAIDTGAGLDGNWRAGALTFHTANTGTYGITEKMRITEAGNVGIGTTGPISKLSVLSADNAGSTNIAVFMANNQTQGVGIGYADIRQVGTNAALNVNANGTGMVNIGNTSTGGVSLVTGGGNVGIGTATPLSKLAVLSTTEQLRLNYDAANYATFTVGSDSTMTITNSAASGNIYINPNAALYLGTAGTDVTVIGRTDTAAYYTAFNSYNAETMRIVGGNVGIGTITPVSKLHVQGDIAAKTTTDTSVIIDSGLSSTANILFRLNGSANWVISRTSGSDLQFAQNESGNAIRMVLQNGGNVGIGTTSPNAKLDVNGNVNIGTNAAGGILYFGNQLGGGTANKISYSNSEFGIYTDQSVGINFYTAGTNRRMIIDNAGNVGINTATPTSKLMVYGGSQSIDGGGTSNAGNLYLRNNSILSNTLRNSGNISVSAGLKGRIINRNSDFLDGVTGYSQYNNAGGTKTTIAAVVATSSPSSSGQVMRITYDGTGTPDSNPTPGYGGFYLGLSACSGTNNGVNGYCYRYGERILYTFWANIPVGRTIYFASNSTGNTSAYQWITSQTGTGNWEMYQMEQQIDTVGSFSSTGFFYITGGSNASFTWDVARFEMLAVDEGPSVQVANTLNVGYYQGANLDYGQLLTSGSTYLGVSSGNVGIGTTTVSAAKLVVAGGNGNKIFATTDSGTAYLIMGNTNGGANAKYSYMGMASGGYTLFGKANDDLSTLTEYMRIEGSTGNVGIGTTSPTQKLSVVGQGIFYGSTVNYDPAADVAALRVGYYSTDDYGYIQAVKSGSAYKTLAVNPGGGNVGIGTTAPAGLLHVQSPNAQIIFAPSGNQTETTDNIGIEIRPYNYLNGNHATRLVKADEGGGIPLYIQGNENGDNSTWTNLARFGSYTANSNKFETFGQTALATGGGNVGIGTATPLSVLQVHGNYNNTGAGGIMLDAGDAGFFYNLQINPFVVASAKVGYQFKTVSSVGGTQVPLTFDNAGNVGINTTTPGRTFVVAGDMRATGILYDSSNSAGSAGMILQTSGSAYTWVATSTLGISGGGVSGGTNGYVARFTSATAVSSGVLMDNGTVAGVNATSSSIAFNIQGTGTVDPLQVGTSTNTSMLYVKGSTGNVGIGTSNPSSGRLHVVGPAVGSGPTIYSSGDVVLASTADLFFGAYSYATGDYIAAGGGYLHLMGGGTNGGTTQMVVRSGNVGIGTATPTSRLMIQGSGVTADLFRAASSTGINLLSISPYGAFVQDISSSTAVSIKNGSGSPVFEIDTTQTSANSGIDITAGATQTGNLLNMYSSGGQLLGGYTAFGGLFQNISSTTAINIQNGAGALVLNIDTVGKKVGIGTSTGMSALDIISDISIVEAGNPSSGSGTATGLRVITSDADSPSVLIRNSSPVPCVGQAAGCTAAVAAGGAGFLTLESSTSSNTSFYNFITAYSGTARTAANAVFRVRGDGNVYGEAAFNASGADYAEYFDTWDTSIEAGDLVIATTTDENLLVAAITDAGLSTSSTSTIISQLETSTSTPATSTINTLDKESKLVSAIQKSSKAYDQKIIGIVSSQAAFIGNNPGGRNELNQFKKAVGLVGRVPVKATDENGEIKVGDFVTSSAQFPGRAMKATRSGYVLGVALEEFKPNATSTLASSTSVSGTVLVFIKPGYQMINNVFTLEDAGGQLTGQVGTSTMTNNALVIDQHGVGDILQLQDKGQNRVIFAQNGSMKILAGTVSEEDVLLSVQNASSTLFSINARGDAQVLGAFIMKDNTFAGSIATDGQGMATIDFTYHLGRGKPVVQLTAESETPVFAQVAAFKQDGEGNYIGFVIKTFGFNGQPVSSVVHYNVTGKPDGYQTQGEKLQVTETPQGGGSGSIVPSGSGNPIPSASGGATGQATAGDYQDANDIPVGTTVGPSYAPTEEVVVPADETVPTKEPAPATEPAPADQPAAEPAPADTTVSESAPVPAE